MKCAYPANRRPNKKLTDAVKLLILNSVIDNHKCMYLREIRARLLAYNISSMVICNFLKEMNFRNEAGRVRT